MHAPKPITIESHPPERRRARTETLMCGCCCCCCCCLHTVGGLIGSAIAPAFGKNNRMPIVYYYDEEFDAEVPSIASTGPSAVKVLWLVTLLATILGLMMSTIGGGEGFVIGLVIMALVFPAVQLACGILVLIWLALSSRPDRGYQLKQTGKIVLGLFVGTAAGIMAMVGIGVVMSAF